MYPRASFPLPRGTLRSGLLSLMLVRGFDRKVEGRREFAVEEGKDKKKEKLGE